MSDQTYFRRSAEGLPAAKLEAPFEMLRPLAVLAAIAFVVGFCGCLGVEILTHRIM